MSDWKKRNEDWRDEDELEEEEECECPWVDSKGKVRETAYCQYLLEKHPMMCLKQNLLLLLGKVVEHKVTEVAVDFVEQCVLVHLAVLVEQLLCCQEENIKRQLQIAC